MWIEYQYKNPMGISAKKYAEVHSIEQKHLLRSNLFHYGDLILFEEVESPTIEYLEKEILAHRELCEYHGAEHNRLIDLLEQIRNGK